VRMLMNNNNSLGLNAFLIPIVLLILLSPTPHQTLSAASYSAITSGSGSGEMGCDTKPIADNLWAGDGLVFTASDACSWSVSDVGSFYEGGASAGVNGSDTSLSNRLLEVFQQVCVEPMADARTDASCAGACNLTQCSHSGAHINLSHRIIERAENPLPPELPDYSEIMNSIKVQVRYRISSQVIGQAGYVFVYGSTSISGCNINFIKEFNTPTEYSDIWKGTVMINCVLNIASTANTDGCNMGATRNHAESVVNSFLAIDPTWEYAQHFVVEQESLLFPAQNKEVSRDWMHLCECDIEPDGDVDGSNLYAFMQDFGRTDCSEGCPGDLNGDGKVDEDDLVLFAGDFGKVNCK